MRKITCLHEYVDDAGESHFDEVEIDLEPIVAASPATSPGLSALLPATEYRFIASPPEGNAMRQFGGWHRAGRGLVITLRGEWEMQTTDGSIRRFAPGDMVLMDETRGPGHRSRMLGTDGLILGVYLPE